MTTQIPKASFAATPLIECWCSGDAHEMGLSQGRSLRDKIVGTCRSLKDLEAFRLEQPWWLPLPLFIRLAEGKAAKQLTAALRHSNPAMLERLMGIAEGAGLPLRSVCLMNAMEAFIGSVAGRTVAPPLGACSALAIRGARSRASEPVIAKNFDYLAMFQPFFMLRVSRPSRGNASLDFAVAPQAGTVDGVNDKGLAITLNYAFVTDSSQPNSLVTMLIADALASCSTVAEAVDFITARPHWGSGILMLADASGELASVELSNTRAGIRRPAVGTDYLLVTNVCRCSETAAVQVAPSAAYAANVPRPLRGQPVITPHEQRARRIEELVFQQPCLGPDELAAIMADHGPSGAPDGASPCVHTDYFNTTASLQWYPLRRCVRISYGKACQAHYVEIAL